MSKNLKILIALVLVVGVAYWFIAKKPWNTLKGELKDFAIKDTANVTRMFFADKRGNKVLLQRDGQNGWKVDNTFTADPDKINLMLATMHDLQVKNPVSDKSHNTVIGILATDATKAEFYNGDDLIKTIYVGSSTPDQLGTYMLIDGSSVPFVTHINGFVGYLSPRFITEAKKWKTKEIFNIPATEIKEVSVQYPMNPKQSFGIKNGTTPELTSNGNAIPSDAKFLKYYLGGFKGLFFEGYAEAYTPKQIDSIYASTPFCIVKVSKENGGQVTLQVHIKPVDRRTKEQYDEKGNPLPYDPEKYYAFVNNEKEMVIIQHYSFGRLFRTLDEIVALR